MAITPDGKLAVTAHKEAGSLTVVDLGAARLPGRYRARAAPKRSMSHLMAGSLMPQRR